MCKKIKRKAQVASRRFQVSGSLWLSAVGDQLSAIAHSLTKNDRPFTSHVYLPAGLSFFSRLQSIYKNFCWFLFSYKFYN